MRSWLSNNMQDCCSCHRVIPLKWACQPFCVTRTAGHTTHTHFTQSSGASLALRVVTQFLCAGPLRSDQVLPRNHHYWLQRLPLLRSALVQDVELVRTHTQTRTHVQADAVTHFPTQQISCFTSFLLFCLMFYFVADFLRFVSCLKSWVVWGLISQSADRQWIICAVWF